jgi:CRISPR-associated protein Csm5
MSNAHTFHITIQSPVHIGCGEDYEPTSFVIDEQRALLTPFAPLDFIAGLSTADKERLKETCARGTAESLLDIYRFMRGKTFAGPRRAVCRGCHGTISGKHFRSAAVKANRTELNRLAIARTAFDPYSNRPYIPARR